MSIYRRGDVWWYRFTHRGVEYRKSTRQTDRDAAKAVEHRAHDLVRQRAAGVAVPMAPTSPTFQDWSEIYFDHVKDKVGRPDRIEDLVRSALRFWGAPPASGSPGLHAPHHDVRLSDVVDDPSWLLRWEEWLERPKPTRRGYRPGKPAPLLKWSAQTKNQYRSLLSQMFKLAMAPAFRLQTGITFNPFAGGYRDPSYGREIALDRDDLLAILAVSSYHLRLAIAIGVLTPKLREGNILALRFDQHVSADLRYITVRDHKTRRRTRRPLVAYVPDQLREILEQERARRTRAHQPQIVLYRGQPIASLAGAVEGAVTRAAATRPHLRYGRAFEDGITFHTIRHTAATLLAELEVAPEKRQALLQHERLETTMKYTHLRPRHEAPAAEQLSMSLPIKELVLQPWRRAVTRNRRAPSVTTAESPDNSMADDEPRRRAN